MSTQEKDALDSIAEVITEARALVKGDETPDYSEALVDLTMQRIRSDVAFLIIGDYTAIGEIGEPTVGSTNGTPTPPAPAKVSKWWISDHPTINAVVHADKNCMYLRRAYGKHPATNQDMTVRERCGRCAP
jgi:hypothetical protein